MIKRPSKFKKIIDIILDREEENEIVSLEEPKIKNTSETSPEPKVYVTVTQIAQHFKIEPADLNNIFASLKWSYKKDKWWIATDQGISKGAKQFYHTASKTKYLKWDESIKKDFELIKAVKEFKENQQFKATTPKEKGNLYEEFIADHYRRLGYVVWEHGKDKGRKDRGIDLIVKKGKEITFIQCKNWRENTRFQIDHKEVKASRTEARAFMKDNPLFIGYKVKFRYTLSSNCIHPSAIKYIEETNGLFDYEILPMVMQ